MINPTYATILIGRIEKEESILIPSLRRLKKLNLDLSYLRKLIFIGIDVILSPNQLIVALKFLFFSLNFKYSLRAFLEINIKSVVFEIILNSDVNCKIL